MGQTYTSKELIKLITDAGWYLVETKGSQAQYKHPVLPGRVTVPHPKKEIAKGTAHSILRHAGLK